MQGTPLPRLRPSDYLSDHGANGVELLLPRIRSGSNGNAYRITSLVVLYLNVAVRRPRRLIPADAAQNEEGALQLSSTK